MSGLQDRRSRVRCRNYAIYLAGSRVRCHGVDSSPAAIRIAQEHAKKQGCPVQVCCRRSLGDLHEVTDTFDFAYDWELLHHIFPEDRETYIRNVHKITDPGAMYFSVCFDESDPQFGGSGKYRTTRIGTTLYFSSESEIRNLTSPYFDIRELKTIEVKSKFGPHQPCTCWPAVLISLLPEKGTGYRYCCAAWRGRPPAAAG